MKRRARVEKKVLILNANYMPLALISWQKAIVLSCKYEKNPSNGIRILDYYGTVLTCGNRHLPLPSVAITPKYVNKKKVAFSKKHVFLRDNLTCCYCGRQDLTGKSLTYDHVIPRSKWKQYGGKGTPTNWTNIVTCCFKCNNLKGDSMLSSVNMKLNKKPIEPNPTQFILGMGPWTQIHPHWEPYLTPIYKKLWDARRALL